MAEKEQYLERIADLEYLDLKELFMWCCTYYSSQLQIGHWDTPLPLAQPHIFPTDIREPGHPPIVSITPLEREEKHGKNARGSRSALIQSVTQSKHRQTF